MIKLNIFICHVALDNYFAMCFSQYSLLYYIVLLCVSVWPHPHQTYISSLLIALILHAVVEISCLKLWSRLKLKCYY